MQKQNNRLMPWRPYKTIVYVDIAGHPMPSESRGENYEDDILCHIHTICLIIDCVSQ